MEEALAIYLLDHLSFSAILLILSVAGVTWLIREAWARINAWITSKRSDVRTAEDRESELRDELSNLLDRYRKLHEECERAKHEARQVSYGNIEVLQGIRDLVWRLRTKCRCGQTTCPIRDALHDYLAKELGEITDHGDD